MKNIHSNSSISPKINNTKNYAARYTTLAIGEEGQRFSSFNSPKATDRKKSTGIHTTMALGEEGQESGYHFKVPRSTKR